MGDRVRTAIRSKLTGVVVAAVGLTGVVACSTGGGSTSGDPAGGTTSASGTPRGQDGGAGTAADTSTVAGTAGSESPTPAGDLRVGAARVDVSPTAEQLPERYTDVHDPLFSRAIAVQNDGVTAMLITVDAGGVSSDIWTEVTQRLSTELAIAPENVLLAATHSHSAGRASQDGYVDGIVRSATEALAAAEPARMSVGTGSSDLNINRNIIDKDTGTWWEGPNPDGPSDKTVSVVSFQALDGRAIGVYYNYAMHAVINGMMDRISADYPGAASAYIEESLGDGAVAVFSSGAAGDQNPSFFHQTYELREIRIAEYASRGEDISNAMPPGGEGLDRDDPRVALLLAQQAQLSDSMGQLLGEEVLAVNRDLSRWTTGATISGQQTVVSCPGRNRTDQGRAGQPGTYEDGEDAQIRLSLLRIGDLYVPGVNGEVFTRIGQRLIAESPHKNTVLTTLTNGRANSGYIYSDEAAGFLTFEVVSSRLKPGCAENAIVGGLLSLMDTA